MKYTIYLLTVFVFLLSGCKNTGSFQVVFEKSFEEISQMAIENDKSFCIVLSNPECPPCEILRDFLYREVDKALADKVIFNIIDVSLPQNKWYEQLIASKNIPTTLLFSPQGNLETIIQGASKAVTECLLGSLSGEPECSRYLFKDQFSSTIPRANVIKTFTVIEVKSQAGEARRRLDRVERKFGNTLLSLWNLAPDTE